MKRVYMTTSYRDPYMSLGSIALKRLFPIPPADCWALRLQNSQEKDEDLIEEEST